MRYQLLCNGKSANSSRSGHIPTKVQGPLETLQLLLHEQDKNLALERKCRALKDKVDALEKNAQGLHQTNAGLLKLQVPLPDHADHQRENAALRRENFDLQTQLQHSDNQNETDDWEQSTTICTINSNNWNNFARGNANVNRNSNRNLKNYPVHPNGPK